MVYNEIYESALQLIGEVPNTPSVSDYETRASYILANLTTTLAPLDVHYSAATGTSNMTPIARSYVELSKFFPLSTSFTPLATFYLASMLVIDENEELSQRLYKLYTEELERFKADIPRQSQNIIDRYSLLK